MIQGDGNLALIMCLSAFFVIAWIIYVAEQEKTKKKKNS